MFRHAITGLIFSALWAGTLPAQNVELVEDINPGPGGGGAGGLTVFGGNLYFSANHLPHGKDSELWRYDGTNTTRVADINPGTLGSSPANLTVYNGKLYFSASGATGPRRLYEYDGSDVSLTPGYTASQGPQKLTVFGGNLFFRASAFGTYGTELWKLNDNPPPLATQATDVNVGGFSPEHPVVYDGAIYFWGYEGAGGRGRELWRFDGTTTDFVADISPGGQYDSSNPSFLTVYHDTLYFYANNGELGGELNTFGDPAGLFRMVEIPEPSTLVLLALSVLGLAPTVLRRRRPT